MSFNSEIAKSDDNENEYEDVKLVYRSSGIFRCCYANNHSASLQSSKSEMCDSVFKGKRKRNKMGKRREGSSKDTELGRPSEAPDPEEHSISLPVIKVTASSSEIRRVNSRQSSSVSNRHLTALKSKRKNQLLGRTEEPHHHVQSSVLGKGSNGSSGTVKSVLSITTENKIRNYYKKPDALHKFIGHVNVKDMTDEGSSYNTEAKRADPFVVTTDDNSNGIPFNVIESLTRHLKAQRQLDRVIEMSKKKTHPGN